ncbi:GntR family transcriptional regulator [Bacillus sp. OK048]|uniref:GntR family transcriptional regulator n=1 Tax=Bacillus sp. OK048 TaxID=1882761 RepID=UPI0008807FC7|nr:GntR family transcriptional regulator [Bacillus sp. OK048]SDN47018.1 GntR family transcriptional regulator [Bacillus sp. OK048]
MIILIEPESDIPIYLQITNQIIEGIARGLIRPGDSLPSVRSFAADLGVNMHTVNKSYHQLELKGIIRIVPKSGAIITNLNDFNESSFERIKEEYKPLIAESLVLGMSEKQIQALVSSIINAFHQKQS